MSRNNKTFFDETDYSEMMPEKLTEESVEVIEPKQTVKMTGKVIPANLNVRSAASTDSKVVKVIPHGTTVTVEDDIPGWYKVVEEGYVKAEFIDLK